MSNSSLDAEKLEVLGWRAEFGLQEGAEKTVGYFGRGTFAPLREYGGI